MKKNIFGLKLGMSQAIKDNGEVVPLTLVKIVDNMVLAVVPNENDEDNVTIKLGIDKVQEKKLTKSIKGQFDKYKQGYYRYIKSYVLKKSDYIQKGQLIGSDIFEENELINVKGKVIGKGFAGTIKRHNFKRGPMSHGSKNHRLPGSIGGGTDPARVFKGTKMSGHMGAVYRTVKGLKVYMVDKTNQVIYIKGSLPGKNGLVQIFN